MKFFHFKTLLIGAGIACTTQTYSQLPTPPEQTSGFVQDYAQILNSETKAEANNICTNLWEQTQTPLFVVTLNTESIHTNGIEKTAQDIFDTWGIGTQERNYGILLLVSAQARTSRIEFGKDWDHRYDQEAKQITQEILVPNFKAGDYNRGILEGTQALSQLARGNGVPQKEAPPWLVPSLILGTILCIAVAISLIRSGKTGWGWAILIALAGIIFMLLRNSSKSGPLGGGSSGGGGATGKW